MKIEETFVVFDPENDKILCCGKNLSFEDFVPKQSDMMWNPTSKEWEETLHYHCPICKGVVAYKRGCNYSIQWVKDQILSD